MSLQNNWESIYGASLKEAYHKILEANFNYTDMTVTLRIGIYCDQLSKETNKPPVYIRKVVLPIDEKVVPVRKPMYDYLKTTTNYQESKDV